MKIIRANPMHPTKASQLNWQNALQLANQALRCGAKTRKGTACKSPAMQNGRCRMHGGNSKGARSGCLHWNYKHGFYCRAHLDIMAHYRALIKEADELAHWHIT